jgi:hypothetical protein
MGPRQVDQAALFYGLSLEDHVPADHLLRSIGRFVDLSGLRRELAPLYSSTGRPSVDPELMIRMLIIGIVTLSHRVARVGVVDARSSTAVLGHETRTYSRRPSSSMRFSTPAAVATSVR